MMPLRRERQRQQFFQGLGVAAKGFPFKTECAPAFASGPRQALRVLEREEREAVVLGGRGEFRSIDFAKPRAWAAKREHERRLRLAAQQLLPAEHGENVRAREPGCATAAFKIERPDMLEPVDQEIEMLEHQAVERGASAFFDGHSGHARLGEKRRKRDLVVVALTGHGEKL